MSEVDYLLMLTIFGAVLIVYLLLSSIGREKEVIVRKERNVLLVVGLFAIAFLLLGDYTIVSKEYQIRYKDQGECHDSTSKQYSH